LDADLNAFLQKTFGCSADVAVSIGRRAVERRYPVRAVIIRQGDRIDATFLLVAGRVHALSFGADGQLVLVHEFLAGDFFGAVAQAEPLPADTDVQAVESSRTAVFLLRDFLALIETYGCVGVAVSKMLLKQLRATAAKMVEQVTLSATGRVYAELLRLAKLGDGRAIRPAPILSALAVRVHSTRETVSRTINALVRRGIVRREGSALVIVAPQRLEEMIV
jgi:CRP/FNR family transcriptional regulator, cyclic AMP receptor protein